MTNPPRNAMRPAIAKNPPTLELEPLSLADQLLSSMCRNPNTVWGCADRLGLTGFVYVVEPEGVDGVCKVGSTNFLASRLAELQCGAWEELRCAGAVGFKTGDAILAEFATHRALTAAGYHRRGEWFNISGHEALNWIVHVARQRGDEIMAVADHMAAFRADHEEYVLNDEIERRAKLRRKLGMD